MRKPLKGKGLYLFNNKEFSPPKTIHLTAINSSHSAFNYVKLSVRLIQEEYFSLIDFHLDIYVQ